MREQEFIPVLLGSDRNVYGMAVAFDEEYGGYLCDINMDEDDFARLMEKRVKACPYYKNGDEYRVVRHQN